MNTKRAFTLLEMIVVIAIIAILAAIMVPVAGHMITSGKKAKAKGDVKALTTVWKKYYNEYGHWPTNLATEAAIEMKKYYVDMLSCYFRDSYPENPKRVVFMERNEDSLNAGGDFVDPWGGQYKVLMDINMDNTVTGPNAEKVYDTVIAWSPGVDKTEGTADDIYSTK